MCIMRRIGIILGESTSQACSQNDDCFGDIVGIYDNTVIIGAPLDVMITETEVTADLRTIFVLVGSAILFIFNIQ